MIQPLTFLSALATTPVFESVRLSECNLGISASMLLFTRLAATKLSRENVQLF